MTSAGCPQRRPLLCSLVVSLLLCGYAAHSLAKNPAPTKEKRSKEESTTEFWIAPDGSDKNSGKTAKSPWKTFDYAIPKLKPGSTLVLRDGTYNTSNSGYVDANCAHGAANGTDAARITIKAENERKAFIQGAGNTYPVQIQNCSFWNLEGLHVENGDFKNNGAKEAKYPDVVFLYKDQFLILKRNLLARNNRYANSHLIDNYYTTRSLYEENEFYYFHRHAILDMYGDHNIFRRNYFNSRAYADLPDGRYSTDPKRGDGGVVLYPAHDDIVENNISEGQDRGSEIQCAYAENACNNNSFFGNISLRDVYGHVFQARNIGDAFMPHNSYLKDDVVLAPITIGLYARATKNTTCENCTYVGSTTSRQGFIADAGERGLSGDRNYSIFIKNSLVIGFRGNPGVGFAVSDEVGSWNWGVDHVVAYGNSRAFDRSSRDPHIRNATDTDPKIGNCLLWIPAASPLKGAANGQDIGANILYRYENGQLTKNRLWDRSSGEFPHGAVVPGLNDVAGQSEFDVQTRLNVNLNGCTFPAGY